MNTIETALIKAGVPVPGRAERVWLAVKDTPGVCARELAKRFNGSLSRAAISRLLYDMEQRGMVYGEDTQRGSPRKRSKVYYTDLDAYKLLPRLAKETPLASPAPKMPDDTTPSPQPKACHIDLDSMTIAQARELYMTLHKMFG